MVYIQGEKPEQPYEVPGQPVGGIQGPLTKAGLQQCLIDLGLIDDPNNLGETSLVTQKVLLSGNETPAVGDTVTYTIGVMNNGPDDATGVSLTDLLPTGLTADASNGNATQGTYDPVSGLWDIGTIPVNGLVEITLSGTVDVGFDGLIVNTTTAASGNENDPNTDGDELEVTVEVPATSLEANPDDAGTVTQGGSAPINLLANDNDPEGTTITVTTFDGQDIANSPITTADGIIVTIAADGTGTKEVPATVAPGTYTYTYEATDQNGDDASSTCVIVVEEVLCCTVTLGEQTICDKDTDPKTCIPVVTVDCPAGASADDLVVAVADAAGTDITADLDIVSDMQTGGSIEIDTDAWRAANGDTEEELTLTITGGCEVVSMVLEYCSVVVDEFLHPYAGQNGQAGISNTFYATLHDSTGFVTNTFGRLANVQVLYNGDGSPGFISNIEPLFSGSFTNVAGQSGVVAPFANNDGNSVQHAVVFEDTVTGLWGANLDVSTGTNDNGMASAVLRNIGGQPAAPVVDVPRCKLIFELEGLSVLPPYQGNLIPSFDAADMTVVGKFTEGATTNGPINMTGTTGYQNGAASNDPIDFSYANGDPVPVSLISTRDRSGIGLVGTFEADIDPCKKGVYSFEVRTIATAVIESETPAGFIHLFEVRVS